MIKKILFLLIFLLVSSTKTVYSSSMNVDDFVFVARVIDGDRFETANGIRVRLADIDAPDYYERGYKESKAFLESLIFTKEVYLDIDPNVDLFGRLICVVYIAYNTTHYININNLLVLENNAVIDDYPNEFDPYAWSLYTILNDDIESVPYWIVYIFVFISVADLVILFLYRRQFIEARFWP